MITVANCYDIQEAFRLQMALRAADIPSFIPDESTAQNPARSPFPQRRSSIRAILKSHKNENGLFVTPVPVQVTGSLLWDGEHRAPNNVGPEGLWPTQAWEIHPIKLLAERQEKLA